MFDLNKKDITLFEKYGYIKLSLFKNNNKFHELIKSFKKDFSELVNNKNISAFGGYRAGNLNINPGKYGPMFLDFFNNENFAKYFEYLVGNNISNYKIFYGGNLNLPNSKNQLFHTDGNWDPRMIVLNIAMTKIDLNNGPLEVINFSHKQFLPYWFFIIKNLFKKNRRKIELEVGEILIREHRLWHRGTSNKSKFNREMLGIMFLKTNHESIETDVIPTKVEIFDNMYDKSFKGKLNEFIFLKFKFILVLYKMLISLKK